MVERRVAIVAPPFVGITPEGPVGYGGTELVVYNLAKELATRDGYHVTVFASAGSEIPGAEMEYYVDGPIFDATPNTYEQRRLANRGLRKVARTIGQAESRFDIVHNHAHPALKTSGWFLRAGVPRDKLVSTLHGPLTDRAEKRGYQRLGNDCPALTSISYAQRDPSRNWQPPVPWAANIYHGIDLSRFPFDPNCRRGDYLVCYSRIAREKGIDTAIKVAERTDRPLVIAGPLHHRDEMYFQTQIEPRIDNKMVTYVGPLTRGPEVCALLGGAVAALAMVRWPEPFGLGNVETMACRTPVVAMDKGSMREIIVDQTGFVCRTIKEVTDAVNRIFDDPGCVSRQACRDNVATRFNIPTMVDGYVRVYEEMMS